MNKPQLFKALTIVALFLLLLQATAYVPSQTATPNKRIISNTILNYDNPSNSVVPTAAAPSWWNSSWHYRIYLNVSFSFSSDVNYSVSVVINFTKEMEQVTTDNKTIDVNSIRVVEYDAATGDVITEVPSKFIPFSYWDPDTNAVGTLIFLVTAPIQANVNRTYHIYYDTTFFGPKSAPAYSKIFDGYWEQFYPLASDGNYATPDAVPYVSPPYVERQHSRIYYTDNTNYPGESYPNEVTNLDLFCGNWTTWLYVNTSGNFGFRLYSDDGSWLLLNDTIVVNNGGNHSPRSVSNTIYLTEGVYKLTVKWYERGGAAVTHLYWTYPGASEELLTTTIYGFEDTKLMDYSALPTRTIGKVETSFLMTVTVVDKTNTPVESTDIHVYTDTTNTLLFSTRTDVNGKAYLTLTRKGTYRIVVRNETAYPTWSSEKIWVENNSYTFTITDANQFSKVNTTIVLPLSTIDLLVTDLNGNPMKATPKETTEVLLFNASQVNMTGSYIQTNSSGYVHFYRIPSGDYFVKFRYSSNYYNVFYDESIMGSDSFSAVTSGVQTVTIGITTINVRVVSVDNYPVPSASVTLANDAVAPTFLQYNTTQPNGIATFYHVLNSTWYLSASYTNPLGQHIENNTVQFNFQSDAPKDLTLNITHLHIKTIDQTTGAVLVGTNVSIYEVTNSSLVMSLSTNSSGWASFYFILSGTYNISANYQGNKNTTTPLQQINSETELTVIINVQYTDGSSYLFAESNAISFVYWNDNITLLVNYSYYDGTSETMVPITSPDWVNFTVNLGSTVISTGTLENGLVINNTNGTYTLVINTTFLQMYPSDSYYTLVVKAKYTGHADPYPILYTVQVSQASTNIQTSKSSVSVNWTDVTSFTVQYIDTTHTLPIPDANVTYSIYNSTNDLIFETTTTSTTNTYTINIQTELHNLVPGEYTIEIFVGKKGYQNRTITVALTVVDAATQIQLITTEPINVTWGQQIDLVSRYVNAVNSSDITEANVYMVLNNTYLYNLTYNPSTGYYEVSYNSSKLFSGVYSAVIHASREYYVSQTYSFMIYINPVPIHYVFVSGVSSSYNVTWTDVLELQFYIQTNETNTNITTANIELSWSPILHKNEGVFNDTLGLYIVVINTSEVYTGSFDITLKASLTNYTLITYPMKIVVNEVPTEIAGPEELTVVWNRNLALSINYVDTYHNNVGIPDAIVTVTFGGQTNIMNMLGQNGTYYLSIPSNIVDPGIHNLTIVAQKQNYQLITNTINVTVLVPVQITAEDIVGYWGTETPLSVNVTNTFNNTEVENGSVIVSVGDVEVQLTSAGNGTYTGTLNLGNFKTETPYTMSITFVKDMYEQARVTKSLYVNLVPTSLEILSWLPGTANNSIEEGTTNNVTLIVFYNNTLTGKGITNAYLYATWENQTYNLTEVGPGEYKLYLDISNLTASPNPYTIEIHATKGNYTESVTTFTFTIYESTITIPGTNIKIPRSIVMTGVGGSVISITTFGAALYGYRLYKIPKIIRQLDKIIKLVAKGQTPDFTQLPTTEQMLKDALADLFTSLPGTEIDKLIKKEI